MTSIPPKPTKPTLRALFDRLGAAVDAAPVTAQQTPRLPAPPSSSAGVSRELEAINRSERRARARAERDRLGHKYGARAKAKKRRRLEQQKRADQRYERRFKERIQPCWGPAADALPRMIPRRLWLKSWDSFADSTGSAVIARMRREPNQAFVGAVYCAALGCDAQGRNPTRTWASPTARAIATISLALAELQVPDRRQGGWTGGVVRGIPQGLLSALVTLPGTGAAAPHRNTLSGRHRGAGSDPRRGQAGWVDALEAAGALFSRQPRITEPDVQPFEVGPRGFVCKRYYLVSPTPAAATTVAMRALLVTLHRIGRMAMLGRPRAVQKPAFYRAQHPKAPALEAPS